jgi:hypothetical protein
LIDDHKMTTKIKYINNDSKVIGKLLEPLFYFDIFSYPLSASEILNFSKLSSDSNFSLSDLNSILDFLVDSKFIYCINGFYMLQSNPDCLAKRIENNNRATRFLKIADKMCGLMRRFPFVRAVFISGSLSKNVMPADGDIDYFIITKPNRLWICRTFLILFKKIFLFNSYKYFCVNYFVDDNMLEIEEKNRFTATEIATVLPLCGRELYLQFMNANQWIDEYYPDIKSRNVSQVMERNLSKTQRFFEFFLNGKFGDWLDTFFMNKTIRHWKIKFGDDIMPEDFEIGLKSKKNVSKHHPQLFQQKVIAAFNDRVSDFQKKHGIKLDII